MKRLSNFVGGQYVAPGSGQYIELINPATEEVLVEMPLSNGR